MIKINFIKHRRWKRFLKSIFQNENISLAPFSFTKCKNKNQLDLSENLLPDLAGASISKQSAFAMVFSISVV